MAAAGAALVVCQVRSVAVVGVLALNLHVHLNHQRSAGQLLNVCGRNLNNSVSVNRQLTCFAVYIGNLTHRIVILLNLPYEL